MRYVLFALIFIQTYCSCQSNAKPFNNCLGTNLDSVEQLNVKKEIPIDKKTKKQTVFKYQKWFDSTMGLCSIENGFADLQIRLEYDFFRRTDTVEYFILLKNGETYSAHLYKVLFNLNERKDSVISVVKLDENLQPKSSWDNVIKKIMDLGLMKLPDQSLIDNYPLSMDANNVTVQVATEKAYRIFQYSGPEGAAFAQNYEAKQLMEIIRLLEMEFSIKWIYQIERPINPKILKHP